MTAQTSIQQLRGPLRFYRQTRLPRLAHFLAPSSRVVAKIIAIVCGVFLLGAHLTAHAAVFIVTNTTDSAAGSLRQAILDSNASAGVLDTITFNIPGTGVRTIIPLTALPPITDPVVIDGYTQPGASANTLAVGDNSVHLIELNGNGANFAGLTISAGGCTLRGLVINRFSGNGPANAINLLTNGGNKIEGCFIGVSADGATAQSNSRLGIDIESSPNNTVGGTTPAARNVISCNSSATSIQINGAGSSGTTIQGNYIGTNAAGTAGLAGSVIGIGVNYNGAASFNVTIGGPTAAARNVISGNGSVGISLYNETTTGIVPPGIVIQGNYIGTNAAGTAAIANSSGLSLTRFTNVLIGGTDTGAGNVISGNGIGIGIANGSGPTGVGNLIQGNLIGTNAAGTAAVPNIFGIQTESSQNNTIGGTTVGARNIISGNSNNGVIISSGFPVAAANVVQGNFIGTDITGTTKLPNAANGVVVFAGTDPIGVNTIGGTTVGARNIISGNDQSGISVSNGSNALIQGNFIGTDVNGTGNLGNAGSGIDLGNAFNNTIGGTLAGAGNVIAFNGTTSGSRNGVALRDGTGNAILGNSIFLNGKIGINLLANGDDGVTPNDPCDVDTGSNNLQNFPVLTSVTNGGGITSIVGTLNSVANTTYRIEFFANDVIDPSGYGEGQSFVGFTNVTTDANCNASFNMSVPQIAGIQRVTATATDPNGNTSEFSAAIGQLLNISTRLRVQTGDNVLIGGFILTGSDPKKVIVRGIGPSLSGIVQGFLADPTLELHGPGTFTTITNDNWRDTQEAEIAATGIAPANNLESAIVGTLPAGNAGYTAILRGKNNTTGIGVVEAYDLDTAANSKLANISTRGFVETGDNVLIGGLIAGNGVTKVIVRAIGPSLAASGVTGALQDPTLELHDGSGATIATNDNWKISDTGGSQQAEIEATTIPPTDDRESALVRTLVPGNYTAIVRGKSGTTGVALVEAYNLP